MANYTCVYKAILKSRFFDKKFYGETYLSKGDEDPITHYILKGVNLGFNPSQSFNTNFYINRYPDVLAAGINPLYHFIACGEKEGRLAKPHDSWKQFDAIYSILNSSSLFSSKWYLMRYPDVAESGIDALTHYIECGAYEGRNPSPDFDGAFYLKSNPDVYLEKTNPLFHYILFGMNEGRRPKKNNFEDKHFLDENTPFISYKGSKRLNKNLGLVSIILPTKNRNKQLKYAIESIVNQTYQNWELMLIDDGDSAGSIFNEYRNDNRIFYTKNDESQGVCGARNIGLMKSSGKFIAYLDDDNVWRPRYLELMLERMIDAGADCGYAVLKCINQDESLDSEKVFFRYQKFDYEMLRESNYIDLNVFIHTRKIYEKEGGFDVKLKRMVDWDLILRYVKGRRVEFLEYVACEYDNSSSAARISNLENYSYLNVIREKNWLDWHCLELNLQNRNPELISIIICVYGQIELTEQCLLSLYTHPAGEEFEVVLVDNGSDPITKNRLLEWSRKYSNLKVITNPENFGFSLGNNIGFQYSQGERVVFLNNDTEVSPEWLRSLVRPLRNLDIKGVQSKLLYPNGTIQCAGIVFSSYSTLGYPLYKGLPGDFFPSMKSRNFSAITAACLAVRASDFIACKGFDTHFLNGQEDVDFCLRLGGGAKVFRCAADSIVTHHEGKSPGRGLNIEDNRKIFVSRWSGVVKFDDTDYYRNDEVNVINYCVDNIKWQKKGYAIWNPILKINENYPKITSSVKSIAIKIACPNASLKDNWGDYHFAVALSAAFRRKGVQSRIYFSGDLNIGDEEDVSLVLRGLSKFEISPAQINIAWIISHPEQIPVEELNQYDKVFVASTLYAEKLQEEGLINAEVLLQCTDISRFSLCESGETQKNRNLFCANSRKVLRGVVNLAIKEGVDLDIYGEMWEGLAPQNMIKGNKINNCDLPDFYRQSKVVLNDHWDSMKINGFISNRIFDALACGAPLVTDRVLGMPDDIAKASFFFDDDKNSLSSAIANAKKSFQNDHFKHMLIAKTIQKNHNFDLRANEIIKSIEFIIDNSKIL
jgi:GT2 family glycosyltransferase